MSRKHIVFYVIIFVLSIIVYQIIDSYNLKPITSFAAYLLIIFALLFLYSYYSQKKIYFDLDNGEPKKYLLGLEEIISHTKKEKDRNALLLNKSAGLIYNGQFFETYELLHAVNPELLSAEGKTAYYNNLLVAMLLLDKKDDARQLIEEKHDVLHGLGKNERLNSSVRSTLAAYEYYIGNIEKSKSMFAKLLEKKLTKVAFASVNHYLGLIELKQGNQKAAVAFLKEALKNSGETYLKEKTSKLLNSF